MTRISEETKRTIFEMRKAGKRYKEIAEAVGMDDHNLRKRCIEWGIQYTKEEAEEKREKQGLNGIGEAEAKRRIEERCPDVEYISGYVTNRSRIKIRYRSCGHVVTVRYDTKHCQTYNGKCIECIKTQSAEKARQKEERRRKWEAEKNRKKIPKAKKARQTVISVCEACGKMYVSLPGSKGCSPECNAKLRQQRHDQARRLRMYKAPKVDKDISLSEVYRIDNGVCWLCGKACDWDDCETTSEGYFIAGNNYPSIDHVVPLSKGGTHTMDNVRLAHRGCNTRKGNKYIPIGKI